MGRRGRASQDHRSDRRCLDNSLRCETQTTEAPHNAVKLEMLSMHAGANCLLSDTTLKIAEHRRLIEANTPRGGTAALKAGTCYGLVGFNGCGKTSLLRLLSDGHLPIPVGWETFLVSQALPKASSRTVLDEVLSVNVGLGDLLSQQAALEEKLEALAGEEEEVFSRVNDELLKVQNELVAWEGVYEHVEEILLALGFDRQIADAVDCHGPSSRSLVSTLSGGWRMKVELAKALRLQPKLLLLDEPTNHLDFQALRWLEDKLQRYAHTALVVSHDVEFLDAVCHEIVWMNSQHLETLPRSMVSTEELAKMQRRRDLKFAFSIPDGASKEHQGCSFHDVRFHYADDGTGEPSSRWQLDVSNDIRFSSKSRCVLLGPNGSGKSSFLKLCAGIAVPTEGEVDRCKSCVVSYFSQHTDDLNRHSELPAAVYLGGECSEALDSRLGARLPHVGSKAKQAVDYEKRLSAARIILRNYGFEGDMADSILIRDLSGGQKALLKLAALSLHPAHILFLDEPTNHLDAHACETLANALDAFEGGIVAATHDDLFIYRLIQCNWSVSELLVCQDGHVQRQAALGAHCITALKEEVRRSERPQNQRKSLGKAVSTPGTKATCREPVQQIPSEVVVVSSNLEAALPSSSGMESACDAEICASKPDSHSRGPALTVGGSVASCGQPLQLPAEPVVIVSTAVDVAISSDAGVDRAADAGTCAGMPGGHREDKATVAISSGATPPDSLQQVAEGAVAPTAVKVVDAKAPCIVSVPDAVTPSSTTDRNH